MMKKLVALMLLFSNICFGALLPPIPTITVGGRVFTDLSPSKLIILYGVLQTGNFTGMIKLGSGSASAYQVTAGKTLHIYAVKVVNATAATASTIDLGYGDTAVAIGGAVSAPTNPVYVSSGTTTQQGLVIVNAVVGEGPELAIDSVFLANKFVFAGYQPSSTAMIYAYGYEL